MVLQNSDTLYHEEELLLCLYLVGGVTRYLAGFILNFFCLCPGCVNVAELSKLDSAEMIHLLSERFLQYTRYLEHHEDCR